MKIRRRIGRIALPRLRGFLKNGCRFLRIDPLARRMKIPRRIGRIALPRLRGFLKNDFLYRLLRYPL